MHALEDSCLLNWTICFKNPCSTRIEKNTATMVVALASDADFCDSHAKVINFREAHIRRGHHAGEIRSEIPKFTSIEIKFCS